VAAVRGKPWQVASLHFPIEANGSIVAVARLAEGLNCVLSAWLASNANLIYQPVGLLIDRRQDREANFGSADNCVSSRPPHCGERQWIASNLKQTFGARATAL
jgi:hypothetical protein